MIKKIKEKVVKETVYIAADGQEFHNVYDCEAYENRLNLDEKLKKIKIDMNDCDYPYPIGVYVHSDDNDYTWFLPKTEEDINLMISYYNIDNFEKLRIDVNEPICLEYYMGDIYIYKLEWSVSNATAFLNKFGYDVVKRKD